MVSAPVKSVQEFAIWAISNLSYESGSNQTAAVSKGAVQSIIAALATFRDDVQIQINCCQALRKLTLNHNSIAMVRNGAPNAVIMAMNAHRNNSIIQEWGCSALSTFANREEHEKPIAAQGAIEVAVEALIKAHPTVERVQGRGIELLINLTMNSSRLKDEAKALNAAALASAAKDRFRNNQIIYGNAKELCKRLKWGMMADFLLQVIQHFVF